MGSAVRWSIYAMESAPHLIVHFREVAKPTSVRYGVRIADFFLLYGLRGTDYCLHYGVCIVDLVIVRQDFIKFKSKFKKNWGLFQLL